MHRNLRRELRFLRAYAITTSLVLVVLCAAAFRQATRPANLGEINVERINVVDADGTLRMVISNKERMHPGVMDGVTIERPRPVAGMLFFNEHGDEVGGLTYTGTGDGRHAARERRPDVRSVEAGSDDRHQLQRRERPAFGGLPGVGSVGQAAEPAHRGAERGEQDRGPRQARRRAGGNPATAPPGPRRVFLGKTTERAATMALSDDAGRPRLTLTVDAAGNPRIEFLDEEGKS